jgi:hypothetical protein
LKTYIGIDNGVTGSIGVVSEDFSDFILTPVRKEQNYTKARDQITRVDVPQLREYLSGIKKNSSSVLVLIERPMINPKMWKATISAVRCMEAEQCVLESLDIPYMFVDSKEWQKTQLPKGTSGTPELKKASLDAGRRLFPQFKGLIDKHKDADGILMARHAYLEKL